MPVSFSEAEYKDMQAAVLDEVSDTGIDFFKKVWNKKISIGHFARLMGSAKASIDMMPYSRLVNHEKHRSKDEVLRALRLASLENIVAEFRAGNDISPDHVISLTEKDEAWLKANLKRPEIAPFIKELDLSDYI